MNRRSFVFVGTAAIGSLPISAALLQSALAQADDNDGWKDLLGNGAILKKTLWSAGTAEGALLKFVANLPLGSHSHPQGEYVYAIEGEASGYGLVSAIGETLEGPFTLKAGEYSFAPAGSIHLPGKVGPQGFTIFTFTPAPIDTTVKA